MKEIYNPFTFSPLGETMKTTNPFNSCVECDQIITNPICSHCLAERMRVMVGEYNDALMEGIEGSYIDGETSCILCGRKMGLCAHCFSSGVYEYIKEKDNVIASEFLSRFDFDLRNPLIDF